uniref:Replication protein A OB domain-containing protein n=1 Tax=Trichogramma kaykai TaxID=54128 RepID=A0ABD2WIK2_9HYME
MIIFSKSTNKEFVKKECTLIDDENTKIHLTLWAQQADLDIDINKMYKFSNLRVTEGNYVKGLNSISGTTATEDHNSSIALRLKETIKNNILITKNSTNNFINMDFEEIDETLLITALNNTLSENIEIHALIIADDRKKKELTLWGKPTNLELEVMKIYSFTNLRITQGSYVKGLNAIVETTAIQETQSPIAIKLLPVLQKMIQDHNEKNTFQNTSDFENFSNTPADINENKEPNTQNEDIAKTINEILHYIVTPTGISNSQEEIYENKGPNTSNEDLIPNVEDSSSFENTTFETMTTDDNNESLLKKRKRFN